MGPRNPVPLTAIVAIVNVAAPPLSSMKPWLWLPPLVTEPKSTTAPAMSGVLLPASISEAAVVAVPFKITLIVLTARNALNVPVISGWNVTLNSTCDPGARM